ncbi:MAG TPA: hypothetical protein VFE50_16755 [Cyclobacteriaceae bacterium]|nr:hypothetical protein [Cyclobacteriaceae bacterium]
MKTVRTLFLAMAVAFIYTSCEESWGNDAKMRFVIAIDDNGDGTCVYSMAKHPDDKTAESKLTRACGMNKVGDGFWIDQK